MLMVQCGHYDRYRAALEGASDHVGSPAGVCFDLAGLLVRHRRYRSRSKNVNDISLLAARESNGSKGWSSICNVIPIENVRSNKVREFRCIKFHAGYICHNIQTSSRNQLLHVTGYLDTIGHATSPGTCVHATVFLNLQYDYLPPISSHPCRAVDLVVTTSWTSS